MGVKSFFFRANFSKFPYFPPPPPPPADILGKPMSPHSCSGDEDWSRFFFSAAPAPIITASIFFKLQ